MRDYDPTTGRYLQADPLGLVDGASVYGYVGGNPGNKIDPPGLFDDTLGWLNGGGTGTTTTGPTTVVGGGVRVGVGTIFLGVGTFVTAVLTPINVGTGDTWPQGIDLDGNPTIDDAVEQPKKRGGQWVCICKARCNNNIVGNCPDENGFSFAFGMGISKSYPIAHLIASKTAQRKLKCQGKHTTCKCTGPTGDPRNDK